MEKCEAARLLLAKASQDEYVLERFMSDPAAADELFGFHAQQAAEKLLKAALTVRSVVYPRTHRLGELLDLSRDHGVAVPEAFDALHRLTPFAVEYRYEFFAEEVEQPLDRIAVCEELRRLRNWVEAWVTRSEAGL